MIVKPTDCSECRKRFMANFALMAEMKHLAATVGPGTAEAELNERFAEEHATHSKKPGT